MKFVLFYHSLLSDWNHGTAHFLRGVATELLARGHQVRVLEPRDAWSVRNLVAEHGHEPIRQFHAAYPALKAIRYDRDGLDLDRVLDRADVVIMHEWNDPQLVARLGRHRQRTGRYRLLFHDTHHRLVTDPQSMARYDLTRYDGVLAYGKVLQDLYEQSGRVQRAWTWHQAADTRVFRPWPRAETRGELVWFGNWGDDERTAELEEFLIEPTRRLRLRTSMCGARYPDSARRVLAEAWIEYAGWLPNFEVPRVFAQFLFTIHVPRRSYVKALPGIPTIRPFEALACGIPLVCSPWDDVEGLFTPGRDFLVARNGREMEWHLKQLLHDRGLRQELAAHGLRTIHSRHTCAHRVDELLAIVAEVRPKARHKEGAEHQLQSACPGRGAFHRVPAQFPAEQLTPDFARARGPAPRHSTRHCADA